MAGPCTSLSTDEGFALALTETGTVYSWGKDIKGRLGHQGSDNRRVPKLVEALASVDVVMVSTVAQSVLLCTLLYIYTYYTIGIGTCTYEYTSYDVQ